MIENELLYNIIWHPPKWAGILIYMRFCICILRHPLILFLSFLLKIRKNETDLNEAGVQNELNTQKHLYRGASMAMLIFMPLQ